MDDNICPVCHDPFTEDDPGVDVYLWLDDYSLDTPITSLHEACVIRVFRNGGRWTPVAQGAS